MSFLTLQYGVPPPPPILGWATPSPPGQVRRGYPKTGYPPSWVSCAWTGYAASGTPLAVSPRTFLSSILRRLSFRFHATIGFSTEEKNTIEYVLQISGAQMVWILQFFDCNDSWYPSVDIQTIQPQFVNGFMLLSTSALDQRN